MDLFKDCLPSLNKKLEHILDENPDAEKFYNSYLVNKAYSYGPDTVLFSNEMNKNNFLDKKLQYDFYWYGLEKRSRYNKWLKAEEVNKMEIIKEYYQCSNKKAKEICSILTNEQFDLIEKKLFKGGVKK